MRRRQHRSASDGKRVGEDHLRRDTAGFGVGVHQRGGALSDHGADGLLRGAGGSAFADGGDVSVGGDELRHVRGHRGLVEGSNGSPAYDSGDVRNQRSSGRHPARSGGAVLRVPGCHGYLHSGRLRTFCATGCTGFLRHDLRHGDVGRNVAVGGGVCGGQPLLADGGYARALGAALAGSPRIHDPGSGVRGV